ncbi:hypothetical protein MNQ95_11865 [Pseudoxanthomonas daejeonensis]|uniref:hypothetical protein n=1 Tax=Pseudoxanthomonas daejeonensis TaxID=266062 RepID=UPI001F53E839|nr:hypothetical protein [Pseudoxanthomonas daejeonensis]UNK56837.1 hypothetical protein MNQ95_11865 [Pseudoxanthomonas daejeonensis]
MKAGYLLDRGSHGRFVAAWPEGEPRRSFWSGLKPSGTLNETRTWRRTDCGYLESYAPVS